VNKIQTATGKTKQCVIFSREIFLRHNCLWPKAVNENTTRPLRKHDVMKVCGTEYLTTEMELSLLTLKSRTVHKIVEYLTLGTIV